MLKTFVEEIEQANKSFLSGKPVELPGEGPPFVVVCCIDPRLTGFIEQALGLPRGRAAIVRVAGNRVSRENADVLRSLAAAIFVKGATRILLIGHTDCGMADFNAAQVAEAFRKADVPRSAFGDVDLRSWFGAIGNIRGNVAESVEFIRNCTIFPPGIEVYGYVIDTATGKLERVGSAHAEAAPAAVAPQGRAAEPASLARSQQAPPVPAPTPPPLPGPIPAPPPARGPVVIEGGRRPGRPEPKPPESLLEAARMFAGVIQRARNNPGFQREVLELKVQLQREKNPLRVLSAIEGFAGRNSGDYPELPALASYLRGVLSDRTSAKGDPIEVIRRVLS